MGSLPSASQLERVDKCPTSHTLQQVHTDTRYSDIGDDVHEFIVNVHRLGDRDAALAQAPEESHRFCEQLPLEHLPTGGRLELSLAWDYETDKGRILGENLPRMEAYRNAKPTEFVGTADMAGTANGQVVIVDWKTGHRALGPAKESWQLRFLALALCRVTGLEEAHVSYVYLRDDGTYHREPAVLDSFELAEFADKLREMPARILGSGRHFTAGAHCRYCGALPVCPAQTALARSMVDDVQRIHDTIDTLTPREAGTVWEKLDAAEKLIGVIRDSLKTYAKQTPLPLSDGRIVREVMWPWTKIDAVTAERVLLTEYGEEVAREAVKLATSQASIEKALAKVAKPLAPAKKRVLELIEEAHGVTTGKNPQVRATRSDR